MCNKCAEEADGRWVNVVLTREVVELRKRVHDDGDERQVELSDVGSDLRVGVTKVCIVAAQQGVDSTDGLFMKEENPTGKKNKSGSAHFVCFSLCTCT